MFCFRFSESRTDPKQRHLNTALLSSSYQPPYYQHNHFSRVPPKVPTFEMYRPKKNDVFTSIILNVLDKIIAATPAIVERLFGRGFRELSNSGYGDSYNYGIGYANQNDLQKLFRNLGFFGYGPLIILNLIEGFTTFMKILRRNQFFKNFLTPALVLLVVTGAIVFLVWWLQSDEDFKGPNRHDPRLYSGGYYDKYNEPYSNYNYHSGGYGNNNNNYGYGGRYGPPGNPRGYFPGRQTTE